MRVEVAFSVDKDSPIGAWECAPKNCPAAKHLRALGKKPWKCVVGLATNAQGAVPLGSCEHKQGDLIEDGEDLFIECGFKEKT